jgi:hypothetical protein
MKAVVGAVAALLVTAAPASAYTFFETPSHNIGCVISATGARCDIREHAWTPPPKPRTCHVDWGYGLEVGRRGFADWVCAGDTVFGGKKVLDYRHSIERGRFKCTSFRNGLRCLNTRNGHGFKLARRAARWY